MRFGAYVLGINLRGESQRCHLSYTDFIGVVGNQFSSGSTNQKFGTDASKDDMRDRQRPGDVITPEINYITNCRMYIYECW